MPLYRAEISAKHRGETKSTRLSILLYQPQVAIPLPTYLADKPYFLYSHPQGTIQQHLVPLLSLDQMRQEQLVGDLVVP